MEACDYPEEEEANNSLSGPIKNNSVERQGGEHKLLGPKVNGPDPIWKIREATLFALSSLSEELLETEETGFDTSSLKHLVEQIFTEDSLIGPLEYPFLYARIFTSVAKLSSLISNGLLEHFLYLAMKAITMDVPPPVKVGACRALTNLLPEAKKEIVQSQLLGLISSLTDLLNHASDETLLMVLDTLLAAVKAGHESSTLVEHMISPVILNVWASHVSDPFISIDALEVLEIQIKNQIQQGWASHPIATISGEAATVGAGRSVPRTGFNGSPWMMTRSAWMGLFLEIKIAVNNVEIGEFEDNDFGTLRIFEIMAIKSIPECVHPLVSRILPYIGPILNKPQEQADGLVAGSLDLNAPADVVKAIYGVSFNAVINIILQSDDHSEIQNATECLSAFISGGRQEILAWGSDSGSTMRSLLDIASR
ncbi:hypothetical protein JHK85_001108 [Glycine max]|nr:hypothetical protein JHK85_001108 [Glycine max]